MTLSCPGIRGMVKLKQAISLALGCNTGRYPAPMARNVDGGVNSSA